MLAWLAQEATAGSAADASAIIPLAIMTAFDAVIIRGIAPLVFLSKRALEGIGFFGDGWRCVVIRY